MPSQQSRSHYDRKNLMASDSTLFDVIVVGAGVEGSATAYQLIKNGAKRVLLLEQFAALHTRGSSGGSSRITRRVYKEAFFVHMMVEAFKTWERLEKEYGQQLYKRTGILVFGLKGCGEIEDIKKNLSLNSVPYQVFPGNEANRRYPYQLKLPSDFECVFEDDGGILFASRCLAAFQKVFVQGGGVIKDYHQVTEVIPGGSVVTVKTNKGNFEAKKVVITTGPWGPAMAKKMGIELPFKVTRVEVLYWKVDEPENFSADHFPVFKIVGGSERNKQLYGLPSLEYPGLVKICLHTGPEVDPDHRDADPAPSTTEIVANAIKAHFKGVSTTPAIYEPCMYTESPDWCPVLDRHPQYPNIIMGFGLSGHGFKLSPVIGKMLCELALDLPPSYDLSPFKVNRFQNIGAKL